MSSRGDLMKLIVIMISTLTSCAAIPTYVTRHGIRVHDKTTVTTPTQSEVEEVTDYVVKHLGHAKNIKGADVILISKWIEVSGPDGMVVLADGYTSKSLFTRLILVSVMQTCFADSGFVHELAHLFAEKFGHSDNRFWRKIKYMEKNIIKDMCPEGYKHKHVDPNYVPPK